MGDILRVSTCLTNSEIRGIIKEKWFSVKKSVKNRRKIGGEMGKMMKNRMLRWILLALSCGCLSLFFACDSCKTETIEPTVYRVQFQTDKDTRDRYYNEGNFIIEPQNPVKGGHTFVGWYNPKTGNYWDFQTDTVKGDTLLVAHFQPTANVLRFESNDGTGNFFTVSAQTGEIRYFPECPFIKTGYRFLGWGERSDVLKYQVGEAYEVKNNYVDYAKTYVFYAIWVAQE